MDSNGRGGEIVAAIMMDAILRSGEDQKLLERYIAITWYSQYFSDI